MSDIKNSANWSFETKQLHIGQEQADPATDSRAVPIYATASYVFHNAQHAADRFGLPPACVMQEKWQACLKSASRPWKAAALPWR